MARSHRRPPARSSLVQVEHDRRETSVKLRGNLDASSVETLVADLDLSTINRVILDLIDLRTLDSRALRALLELHALCRHANRQLAIRSGPRGAEHIIELVRTAEVTPPAGAATPVPDRPPGSAANTNPPPSLPGRGWERSTAAQTPSTVRVEFGAAGRWDVAFADQAQRLTCDTLDQASQVAHVFAEVRRPCELIISNAYHHVIHHELVQS